MGKSKIYFFAEINKVVESDFVWKEPFYRPSILNAFHPLNKENRKNVLFFFLFFKIWFIIISI